MGAHIHRVQRVVFESVLAALAVVAGLVLAAFPNVELVTFVIFFAGVLLGISSGARVGLIAGLAYGIVNPYGLPSLPLLAALVIARIFIGMLGGLLRTPILRVRLARRVLVFAVAGVVATLVFDALTNLALALTMGQLGAVLAGAVPFAALHLVSNVVVFSVLGVNCLEVARHLPIPGLVSREER